MSAMTDDLLKDDEKARLNLTVGNVSFWTDRLIEARKENIKSQQALGEIGERLNRLDRMIRLREFNKGDSINHIRDMLRIASDAQKGGKT